MAERVGGELRTGRGRAGSAPLVRSAVYGTGGVKIVNVVRHHNPPTHEARRHAQPPILKPQPPDTHPNPFSHHHHPHTPHESHGTGLCSVVMITTTHTHHGRLRPPAKILNRRNQWKPPSAPNPPGAMSGHEHQVSFSPSQTPLSPPSLHPHKIQAVRANIFFSSNKLLGLLYKNVVFFSLFFW